MATCVIPSGISSSPNTAVETIPSSANADRALVARARQGDEEAFAALFGLHKRRVYSLCLRMTGDVVEAEDLAQDAFIQVFRKLATFRGDATFSTWLYRVVVNTVLMKFRRHGSARFHWMSRCAWSRPTCNATSAAMIWISWEQSTGLLCKGRSQNFPPVAGRSFSCTKSKGMNTRRLRACYAARSATPSLSFTRPD